MRSTGSGPLGALLMLAPLIAVPILAVVGIPQFAPGNLLDSQQSETRASSRDRRSSGEPRYGTDVRHEPDDLFKSLDESDSLGQDFNDPLDDNEPQRGRRVRNREDDLLGDDSSVGRRQSRQDFDSEEESTSENAGAEFEQTAENDPADAFDKPTRRPGSKSRLKQEELLDDSTDTAAGERFAERDDAEGSLDSQFDERRNAFEQPKSRPNTGSRGQRRPQAAPRDPNDAPDFLPTKEPKGSAGSFEEEPAEPAPLQKQPRAQRVSPKAQPVEPPAEVVEEAPQAELESAAETTEDLTWQVATKRLRALGVGKSKQHFTYIEDRNVFLFTCNAVRLNDNTKTKRFEAEADEPLLAVRQVLGELESWQGSGTKPRTRARTSLADNQ